MPTRRASSRTTARSSTPGKVPQVGTAFIAFNLKNGPFSERDQPRRPHAAHGGSPRHRPRRHPRGDLQQPGSDRQGLLQQVEPVVRQGHQAVAGIRPGQGQGAAQEGQGRRCQGPADRQRHLSLHASVGRAGSRHAEGGRLQRDISKSTRRRSSRTSTTRANSISIRQPTATVSIPTAGIPARSCRRRRKPGGGTATSTRRSTS